MSCVGQVPRRQNPSGTRVGPGLNMAEKEISGTPGQIAFWLTNMEKGRPTRELAVRQGEILVESLEHQLLRSPCSVTESLLEHHRTQLIDAADELQRHHRRREELADQYRVLTGRDYFQSEVIYPLSVTLRQAPRRNGFKLCNFRMESQVLILAECRHCRGAILWLWKQSICVNCGRDPGKYGR